MMFVSFRRKEKGFTLVELAIVLSVAAILLAGLWRLMSGGGQQLRDQSAATQHQQLMAAVKGYLSSQKGQEYIVLRATASGTVASTIDLPLPATAPDGGDNVSCKGPLVDELKPFCDYLPIGFSSATRNSYNQSYGIQVKYPAFTWPNPPVNYSFMILTTGGERIPDSSGGRIASLIGGDGGFVYHDTDVCNTAAGAGTTGSACGAFSSWASAISAYSFAASATGGRIASRSYLSGDTVSTNPWLARTKLGGDNAVPPLYNTMNTDMFFTASGGLTLNMKGNNIDMGGGTIYGDSSTGGYNGHITNFGTSVFGSTASNAALVANGQLDCADGTVGTSCISAIQANGSVYVTKLLSAHKLFAMSFIYDVTSDMRLKENISVLTSSLEKLSRIKAMSFTMKDQDGAKKMGVLAQDVEKVYPELVTDVGSGYKGVDYMGFIAPLIGAVQELKAENEQLRGQLAKQQEILKKIEAKTK